MENKEKTAAVQTTEDTKAADEVTAETTEETKPEAKAGDKKEKKKKDKKQGGIKKMLKTRKFRHGSVAIAITAIVVALVVVLNIIVGLLVDRFPNLKVDFTSNQAYALQNDTKEYIKNIKKDVTLYVLSTKSAFESNGEYFVQAENLLEKMEKGSDGKLSVIYKDTSTDPSFIKKYSNINWDSKTNLAVIECGKQYKALTLDDCFTYDEQYAAQGIYKYTSTTIEQAVVKGALYVTTENKVTVDVIKDNQPGDYSGVTALLNDNAYQVNEISLITSYISKDADFVLLFAPSVDLDEAQTEKLSKWLKNGGKYGKNLIYVASSNPVDTPNLNALLNDWGMAVNTGFVFETDPNHLQVSDPGKVEGNAVFTYLDAFCKPEHFDLFGDCFHGKKASFDFHNLDEVKAQYRAGGLGDVMVKNFLERILNAELDPIRERRKEFEKDIPAVYEILRKGCEQARAAAAATLADVRKAMKIDYFNDTDLIREQAAKYAAL